MHEPVVELLPSLVAVGTVGAHWVLRMRAAVAGKAGPAQHQDGAEAEDRLPQARTTEGAFTELD